MRKKTFWEKLGLYTDWGRRQRDILWRLYGKYFVQGGIIRDWRLCLDLFEYTKRVDVERLIKEMTDARNKR